ncbi:hypothetical protein JW911_01870 [Candidatus Peregrinibacteria bacterium]|nr:hypothetical protein [Candidatus Peregrinibacteria bacterium]
MAFFKSRRKKPKPLGKTRIQEIRSPYSHRKIFSNKKPLKKLAGGKKYSGELKLSYKKAFPFKKILFWGFGGLLILTILYTTLFTNVFLIKHWKIYGDDIIQENSKFEEFLKANENKNLVFLDTAKIENTIKSQYEEIKNIRIKKIYPDTVILEYYNYPEVANLYNSVGETQKKFLINEIGLITQQDYENPNLPFIYLKSEKVFELNTIVIPHEKLEYILNAIYEFEEIFGMKILKADYKPRERELHLKTERNFTIWLDMGLSVQTQYNKLKKAMAKLNIYTDSIEYIDLRISSANGDRVIFKR